MAFYSEEERDEKKNLKSNGTPSTQGNQKDTKSLKRSMSTRYTVKRYFQLQYLDSTIIEYVKPVFVNCVSTLCDKKVLTKGEYDPLIVSKPRESETYFMITKTDQWTFEISLFATYVRDSPELLDRCFEADWA